MKHIKKLSKGKEEKYFLRKKANIKTNEINDEELS